jgi:cysteine sulfinate desulfinase/cysteine desulfurase-like protein
MGIDDDSVMSTLRFSFGATTTKEEIDSAIETLASVVALARSAK